MKITEEKLMVDKVRFRSSVGQEKVDDFIQEFPDHVEPGMCDELIAFFRSHPNKRAGVSGVDGKANSSYKTSTDLSLNLNAKVDVGCTCSTASAQLLRRYGGVLHECLLEYNKKFIFSDLTQYQYSVREKVNIQYYTPGQNFKAWHAEREDPAYPGVIRHLVFMTYLNTVNKGGETEFYYQKLKVKPRKGLTLIWPVDWTYTHRGLPSPEDKYIITGWYSYLPIAPKQAQGQS